MGNLAFRQLVVFFVCSLSIASVPSSFATPSLPYLTLESCISVDPSTLYPTEDGRKAGSYFAQFIAAHRDAFPHNVVVTFWGNQTQEQLVQRIPKSVFPPDATPELHDHIAQVELRAIPLATTPEERKRLAMALGPELANAVSEAYYHPQSYTCGVQVQAISQALQQLLCPYKKGSPMRCAYECTATGCTRELGGPQW
jgi:hypothetical protein